MALDLVARAELPCGPARARRELATLDAYPAWCGIVWDARPAAAADGDPGPAWDVEIGARVGPLRHSKRLRMVRTVDVPREVIFERRELDEAVHGRWVLAVSIGPRQPVAVELRLHYGGGFVAPFVDRVLASEVRASAERLTERVARVG